MTPFRSSLVHEPCVGRGESIKKPARFSRREGLAGCSWPLTSLHVSLVIEKRFLMPQSAAVSALLKPASISTAATTHAAPPRAHVAKASHEPLRSPRHQHTSPPHLKKVKMSAAGYELRGVYGTEPYWPEKKLKICVTGAGGFIASHLAKRLKEEGHYVVGCDWKRNEHMPVRPRIDPVFFEHRAPSRVEALAPISADR